MRSLISIASARIDLKKHAFFQQVLNDAIDYYSLKLRRGKAVEKVDNEQGKSKYDPARGKEWHPF